MTGESPAYRLYTDLAPWWPVISPPSQYAAEARYLAAAIGSAGQQRDALDLGSGGGHVAMHLKDGLAMTLVDLSAQMLAVSRQLNPDCEHYLGDMRTIRLGRLFDVVLVHDAIDYIVTAADLRLVLETAFAHCRPGGIAVFVPDYVADTFAAASGGGGGADDAGRRASFKEWTWDPDPSDSWVQSEYELHLTDPCGHVEVVTETHKLGAFSRRTWWALLAQVGFELAEPRRLEPATERRQRPRNLFTARRPVTADS
jgi:SAM-dependent methyltransferase